MFSANIAFLNHDKQNLLHDSTILIAGMGGLGCVVAQNLVRLGIGKLIILDYDTIAESNLNRQILFTKEDIGKQKVDIASKKLEEITGFTKIIPIKCRITSTESLQQELSEHDYIGIADCLDNYESRYILEDILEPEQFLVHGGVMNDFGQITTIMKDFTISLKELYKDQQIVHQQIPIIPQTVFTIASLMSHEIMNNILGTPQLLNKLLITELSDFSMSKITLQ
jgi:molybdopterin-synthase adenylyltransferase